MAIRLHAGNGRTVPVSRIVGIFDMDTATVSEVTKNYLRRAEAEGKTELIVEELPKSFIVTADGMNYYSQISTSSLIGRAELAEWRKTNGQ
ncbi:MAG: DUF370 domain-containing protein [Clostridia bacterium]|nr:DUF370 domain-containing protein [Clostridia bacterium]MBQ7604591.1 DUF370 domain-containing protein [Clostridia bacterium]